MKIAKWLALALAGVVLALAVVVIARTALIPAAHRQAEPVRLPSVDKNALAAHLSRAVQFKTISYQDAGQFDQSAFNGFHDYLNATFPNLHRALLLEPIGEYSLLYTWKGSDPTLPPVLMMAHQDVVPVAPGTEARWTQPPFSGQVADGYIWGRGSMDDKGNLMALMEAVESLVAQGFQPRRTLYLAFGHDEEVAGTGAERIAALLSSRGVKLDYVIDEGGSIIKGMVPGVREPVALVGTAEKGYASIELYVTGQGGHSSIPPAHTAIGTLSRALYRLELHPMPSRFAGLAEHMLGAMAPAASMPFRMIYANTWLFGPIVESQLEGLPSGNAMIRTTTAETIVEGGVKENVLPTEARAIVNFRILPGDSVHSLVEHVRQAIDDPQVKIRALHDAHDPSVVSGSDTEGFRELRQTVLEVFPEVSVVSPYLVLGATDSRRYQSVCRNIYRFTPAVLEPRDLERIHGTNERVSVDGYARSVVFFEQLIGRSAR